MEIKTEPAGRLFDILQEAKRKSENYTARKVWSEIFEVEEQDTSTLLKMLADLIRLMHLSKRNIEELNDIEHELYLKPFSRLEVIFSQVNLDAQWKAWRDQIDESTLYGLQFCSDRLNRSTNYTKITNDELDKIKDSLSDLVEQILASELEVSLKQLLIRNLERLRQTLIAYRINGIDGIETEIELNLGSILLHKDEIKKKSGENSTHIWKKYFSFLDGLNKTISTAKNVKSLGEGLTKLLEMIQ